MKRLVAITSITLCVLGMLALLHLHFTFAPTTPAAVTAVAAPIPPVSLDPAFTRYHHPGATTCALPATSAVTKAVTPTIYHWTDAQGRQHYGDTPPVTGKAETYTPYLPDRLEYFTLAVDYRGAITVPYFRDKLTPQVNAIYQILGGVLGQQHLRKVELNIALYADRESYLHYAARVTGRNMSNTGGFYSSRLNEAVTYVRPNHDQTLEVAKHESTHVIVAGVLGKPPIWLNEGLADYFAKLKIAGLNKAVSADTAALSLARRSVQQGYLHDLTALFALDDSSWRGDYQSNHYAVSWALMYFLMSSEQGKTSIAGVLQQLAEHYCQPLDSTAVLASSYPGGIARLQKDFHAWLADAAPKNAHYY